VTPDQLVRNLNTHNVGSSVCLYGLWGVSVILPMRYPLPQSLVVVASQVFRLFTQCS